MSKDNFSIRSVARNHLKNTTSEANENEFENLLNSVNYPPPRTPLNSIPDPSQYLEPKMNHEFDYEASRQARSSDAKLEGSVNPQMVGMIKKSGYVSNQDNSRVLNRWKSHSEPNSAHSSPARSISSIGSLGHNTGPRGQLHAAEKGGSSSKVSKRLPVGNFEVPVEVTHFELEQDPSFWNDHNVQSLIRIRPLSNSEKVSQGQGRCLRQESPQSLTWLGHPELRFTFDHIACETISQEKLFRVAGLPMVDNCMSGYNSCMFAYGQTGSGKTYTMIGDIGQMEGRLNEDCGITPRIFEYLFTRIKEEEDRRRDERLKYSCKCSFLEIYNEQITDLLDPSSTNLQLREDLKNGVYVENLKEYNVRTVTDVLRLLLQGVANRKMAATNMNSESSRSHSVFTCIIESHWEKDSMTHLRFGRLNLVDLAGSERQKSSGAEGDRLKEAANINKSLSTLSLVIMSLVDVAHGKHRHVPYKDSRLTFLLQDSLGGNSKTTIIANVSPSVCSASETLSTLKFAQRAKLIQNNAKVNEDASGDVTALQRQIQQLKGQLSFLMKTHNNSRSPSHLAPSFDHSSRSSFVEMEHSSGESDLYNDDNIPHGRTRKIKCLQATLKGALRREKFAETEVKRLEAEVAHMNRLAEQREEDAQLTKMMLRDYEERFKRLELLADGAFSADKYLMDENQALKEEIELLRARSERNPELTRFALENIRLLEQLRLFQNFYEKGEREILLSEVSELRDKLLEALEAQENHDHYKFLSRRDEKDNSVIKELEGCKNMNTKIIREFEELQSEVTQYINQDQAALPSVRDYLSKDPRETEEINKNMLAEIIPKRSNSRDYVLSSSQQEDETQQNKSDHDICVPLPLPSNNTLKELMDSKIVIEALEADQICLIEELQSERQEKHRLMEILSNKDRVERQAMITLNDHYPNRNVTNRNLALPTGGSKCIISKELQVKLDKMNVDIKDAQLLLDNHASDLSQKHETEIICAEAEMQATQTILHLQEEVVALQSELQDTLQSMAEENDRLRTEVAAKEDEKQEMHAEWKKASFELTSFLLEGSKSLKDASVQIEYISSSFPYVNNEMRESVEKVVKVWMEKEETILLLEKSLGDARKAVINMEQKLNSLKCVTMVLTEVQLLEHRASTNEKILLTTILDEKIGMIEFFEKKVTSKEHQLKEVEKCANASLLVVSRLADHMKFALTDDAMEDLCRNTTYQTTDITQVPYVENGIQTDMERVDLLETGSVSNAQSYISSLQTNIQRAASLYKEVVQEFATDIQETKRICVDLKANCSNVQLIPESSKDDDENKMLLQMKDELAKINNTLDSMRDRINTITDTYGLPAPAEAVLKVDSRIDASSLDSTISSENAAPLLYEYSRVGSLKQILGLEFEGGLQQKSEQLINYSTVNEPTFFCIRKEFMLIHDAFMKLNVQLADHFSEKGTNSRPHEKGVCLSQSSKFVHKEEQDILNYIAETSKVVQPSELLIQGKVGCGHSNEYVVGRTVDQTSSFFNKFEEARATMQEADVMLNALLTENESSRQLTGMWRQAGEELMTEKVGLTEEIEQLKSSLHQKDGENKILQDLIHFSFIETAKLIFLLEGSIQRMQRDVEKMCMAVYSDALMIVKEIMTFTCFYKSSLEGICTKAMEREFAYFVLHECTVGEYLKKFKSCREDLASHLYRHQENQDHLVNCKSLIGATEISTNVVQSKEKQDQSALVPAVEAVNPGPSLSDTIYENLELRRELKRKDVVLKGLLFDFSLLQESTSATKDLKSETENLIASLSQTQQELQIKTNQLDDLLDKNRNLEQRLADTESALSASNSDLEQVKETLDDLSGQNAELKLLLKDLYLRKSEAEEQLDEQREVVKTLEKEIILKTPSREKHLLSSLGDLENDLRKVTGERDQLHEQVVLLQDRLDMADSLADENEAIAIEARQESEASKVYAEQKDEEVRILEHSIEELECTVNVLEKKVYEMEEEVERHRIIRDSLELEIQSLRQRLLTVENYAENRDPESSASEKLEEDQLSRKLHDRSLELHEAQKQIIALEKELAEQTKEIKQCKDYISELLLHAEAQASQYQQKYKTLEAMFHEVESDSSNAVSASSTLDKTEKNSTRTRGSSSPFRCIGGLVQQMNSEKDQELSTARLRMKELEVLLASRQKEVCMLNTRLAAAESMTHDVIRDLLGVKLDMTSYANLMDLNQLQKSVEKAQQKAQKSITMEKEILNLRSRIDDLIEERERCISEVNRRDADIFSIQMTVEQIQERDQLLTAQNEMLKVDKTNLQKKVAELDGLLKKICGTEATQPRIKRQTNHVLRISDTDSNKRRANNGKQPLRVSNELFQYYESENSHHSHGKLDGRGTDLKFRMH